MDSVVRKVFDTAFILGIFSAAQSGSRSNSSIVVSVACEEKRCLFARSGQCMYRDQEFGGRGQFDRSVMKSDISKVPDRGDSDDGVIVAQCVWHATRRTCNCVLFQ